MAEVWRPQPKEVYQSWIDAIVNEASDNLNNWESNFIHSVEFFLQKNGTLSRDQANKLEQIYTEKTS